MFHYDKPYFKDENTLAVVYGHQLPVRRYLEDHRRQLHADLLQYGAVLLRDFAMATSKDFSELTDLLLHRRSDYTGGAGLRREIRPNSGIYSTSYTPPDSTIFQHKELAYTKGGPDIVIFFCVQPAEAGGQTPITSFSSVYHALEAPTKLFFQDRTLVARSYFLSRSSWITKTMRRLKLAFGMTWEDSFGTDNLDEVVDVCRRMGKEVQVLASQRIIVSETIPALVRHPVTRNISWYANAYYDPRLFRKLLTPTRWVLHKLVDETYSIFYDLRLESGHRVPFGHLQHLHQTTLEKTRMFDWQVGDCMIIDNRQLAHGRTPYQGPRQVLVAMGAFIDLIDLEPSIRNALQTTAS